MRRDRDRDRLVAGSQLPGQRLPKPEQRPTGPGLDGTERPAQPLGDLGLCQLLAIGQDDRGPFGVRQVREGVPKDLAELGDGELTLGATSDGRAADDGSGADETIERDLIVHVIAGGRRQRDERRASPGCPQSVDRPVASDRVEPGRERPDIRVEQLRPVPEREERFLDDLLGHLPIRCQPVRRREDRVDVPIVEIAEGRLRARRDLADEEGVVERRSISPHRYDSAPPSVSLGTWRGRRSNPDENTTSVSVWKTFGVDWTSWRTRSRSRVSRARTLIR